MSEWIDNDNLTVCINLKGLPGFLAVDPTRSLADDLGLQFDWLPMTIGLDTYSANAPGSTPGDDPLAEYKARRRRAREQWARREFERNCERLVLTEEQATRDFDVDIASMGLLWVRKSGGQDAGAFVREVFDGAYRGNLAMEDPPTIEKLLEICGIPWRGFTEYCREDGPGELNELQEVFNELEVFNPPAYLYRGERFHGREHLPLLKWYLTGQH